MGDDVYAIQLLKGRYFRLLDTKEWDALGNLFTDDVVVDLGPAGTYTGNTAFVDFVRQALEGVTTVHHGHTPEIELTSADEATGIWAIAEVIVRPDGRRTAYARDHETYRRVDGEWRIASLRHISILVDSA